ncbi:unnamed protein product [Medioppia subpectinata]|uniref:Uncharacterized protein n=1 Tax=Medioppia subpectinata TaxID=1979941 RepID=A0A7R9KD49_9ACAR|nr:unnamed protein product [Medioppia subpectinata]CAG2100897.1 unnamed protein product [Medioppia subpectinata]
MSQQLGDKEVGEEVTPMNAEYSLAPFCNWFLPSCLDMWSSGDGQRVLCSYGARSMVCLLTLTASKSIKCYDCLNVFNNNKSIISCNKFSRTSRIPYLFVGSNDGEAALINCNDTNHIMYPKIDIKDLDLPSKKILSADWSHVSDKSVVYYSIHSVIICWDLTLGTMEKLMIGDNYRNKIAISCIVSSVCGQEKLAIG